MHINERFKKLEEYLRECKPSECFSICEHGYKCCFFCKHATYSYNGRQYEAECKYEDYDGCNQRTRTSCEDNPFTPYHETEDSFLEEMTSPDKIKEIIKQGKEPKCTGTCRKGPKCCFFCEHSEIETKNYPQAICRINESGCAILGGAKCDPITPYY